MKRFLFCIFALLYLCVSSGFTLNFHYCMGELADVSLMGGEALCEGCTKKPVATCGCCSSRTEYHKLTVDQKVSEHAPLLDAPASVALLPFVGRSLVFFPCFPDMENAVSGEPPGFGGYPPLFILNCVYLV